jgi:hypothetical protein
VPSRAAQVTYPVAGDRTYDFAPGRSPVVGHGGTLLRFRVAVEHGIRGVDVAGFADAVVTALGNPRGWTADGTWRFQRVAPRERVDFTLYLATPATRDWLCQDGVDRYTSCRHDNNVVLNVARWTRGVPNYGAPLATYRLYMITHEVGHRLDHKHELCPGPGQPAPVMQQQTLGLHGCVANPYPFVDGERYQGSPGAYQDPIPTDPP